MQSQPPNLRALKALVGVLGVLIVLGTALVIGVVIHRIYAGPAAPSMSVAPASSVALAAGEHIAGLAGASGAIAVWVQSPQGARLLLIDPATGAARVALRETR
jgi:hypothetical protein